MAKTYLWTQFIFPLLFILLHIPLTHAIPWQEASSTLLVPTPSTSITIPSTSTSSYPPPTLTTIPQIPYGTLEPPNVCGYVNSDYQNPYTCASSRTCLFHSSLRVAACGSPTSITFHTTCIPYALSSQCITSTNSNNDTNTCISDPLTLHCPLELPHCATTRIGPGDDGYTMHLCKKDTSFINARVRVELGYKGQSILGHLPRWLGSDGGVTLGTVVPQSSSSAKLGSGEGGVNAATVPGGVVTVVVSSSAGRFGGGGGGRRCNSTCRAERFEEQVRKREVAGGVVGGIMGVMLVVLGVWVVWARRRKVKREKGEKESREAEVVVIPERASGNGERERERASTPALEDG